MKVLSVFGTRPEAIKMCPLVLELKTRDDIESFVCVTGQHREMLDSVLKTFNVVPDYNLNIMREKQDLFDVTINILSKIKEVLIELEPDIVLVHGDTSTTYATALACFYLGIKIGHVEAGLRTYNMHSPFPEEFNRQSVSLITDFHFCPTEMAKQNLIREGYTDNLFVTGNTAIDALNTTVVTDFQSDIISWAKGSKLITVTAHRRENLGKPMEQMFLAIRKIIDEFEDVKAVYPIHMNPAVREIAHRVFFDTDRMKIIDPLDVQEFHNLLNQSHIIITDSGGIQEEAPSLGKPVLVMRDTTERPEGVEAGTLKLVGTEEKKIYDSFKELLTDKNVYLKMSNAKNPYGNGTASKQIVDIIEENIK